MFLGANAECFSKGLTEASERHFRFAEKPEVPLETSRKLSEDQGGLRTPPDVRAPLWI